MTRARHEKDMRPWHEMSRLWSGFVPAWSVFIFVPLIFLWMKRIILFMVLPGNYNLMIEEFDCIDAVIMQKTFIH